jgi:hypothetical protein
MAPPMNGPRAIPTTDVIPKILMGILRSDVNSLPNVTDLPLGPFQISAMDPPTKLIATELAPPPKNRVVIMVAKFVPTPEGTRKMRKTM